MASPGNRTVPVVSAHFHSLLLHIFVKYCRTDDCLNPSRSSCIFIHPSVPAFLLYWKLVCRLFCKADYSLTEQKMSRDRLVLKYTRYVRWCAVHDHYIFQSSKLFNLLNLVFMALIWPCLEVCISAVYSQLCTYLVLSYDQLWAALRIGRNAFMWYSPLSNIEPCRRSTVQQSKILNHHMTAILNCDVNVSG